MSGCPACVQRRRGARALTDGRWAVSKHHPLATLSRHDAADRPAAAAGGGGDAAR